MLKSQSRQITTSLSYWLCSYFFCVKWKMENNDYSNVMYINVICVCILSVKSEKTKPLICNYGNFKIWENDGCPPPLVIRPSSQSELDLYFDTFLESYCLFVFFNYNFYTFFPTDTQWSRYLTVRERELCDTEYMHKPTAPQGANFELPSLLTSGLSSNCYSLLVAVIEPFFLFTVAHMKTIGGQGM